MPNRFFLRTLGVLLGLLMIAPYSKSEDDTDALLARFEIMVQHNLDNPHVVDSATLDARARELEPLPLGRRVSGWARWFLDLGRVSYLYGRAEGGYVSEGRLCQDFRTDCVLFMYRTTELARSANAREAVQFAFGTRFYGASIAQAVSETGKVDYDVPVHLEYAEDMIKSGIWGEDVTALCGTSLLDAVGSSRVPPDTLRYLPKDGIDPETLRSGDIIWFVGNEDAPGSREQRATGTLIHHIGSLDCDGEEPVLIHPAARPLQGHYEAGGLVEIPLSTYLSGIERFKGMVVTRLKEF